MDKLCDKMDKAMQRTGMGGRKVIGSGHLEEMAGADGHGPRENTGKFAKPKSSLAEYGKRRGAR